MNTDPAFFLYPPKFVLYFFITNAELLKMVDWKEQYHSFVPKGAILNTVYTDTLVSSLEIVAFFLCLSGTWILNRLLNTNPDPAESQ